MASEISPPFKAIRCAPTSAICDAAQLYRRIRLKTRNYYPPKNKARDGIGEEMHFTPSALYRIHTAGEMQGKRLHATEEPWPERK
jgi:hypothetical protein